MYTTCIKSVNYRSHITITSKHKQSFSLPGETSPLLGVLQICIVFACFLFVQENLAAHLCFQDEEGTTVCCHSFR